MQKIQELIKIIRRIMKEQDDKILNVRGGRGYSAGHPYPVRDKPRPIYGEVEIEQQVEKENKPIKVSKAFKKVK